MMESLLWSLALVVYFCGFVVYFKWKISEIEETSKVKQPKESNLNTPCYDCL